MFNKKTDEIFIFGIKWIHKFFWLHVNFSNIVLQFWKYCSRKKHPKFVTVGSFFETLKKKNNQKSKKNEKIFMTLSHRIYSKQ